MKREGVDVKGATMPQTGLNCRFYNSVLHKLFLLMSYITHEPLAWRRMLAATLLVPLLVAGFTSSSDLAKAVESMPADESVEEFLDRANEELRQEHIKSARKYWVAATYITPDTSALAAEAGLASALLSTRLAKEQRQFRGKEHPPMLMRQLDSLRKQILPAPDDVQLAQELATIAADLEAQYGAGKYCKEGAEGEECQNLQDLSKTIADSRNFAELLKAWSGWRTISPPMRQDYVRMVEIANQGAKELGYSDLAHAWRSGYDMSPEDFSAELDRLWEQVFPLYESLHCHVRAELADAYGDTLVDQTDAIDAHLLGNMWAQQWDNIYDIIKPHNTVSAPYDLTDLLLEQGYDDRSMTQTAENFFSSLGFEPLPASFWENSQFVKPRDRDVVCHASAWTMDPLSDDLRIKMCIETNAEEFQTIHHELGHLYYDRAYSHLPVLLQGGAHDGFHEAVGDLISLSITPEYLRKIGLIEKEPPLEADLDILFRSALEKVSFLPFGLLVDQWRFRVFTDEIPADRMNEGWWQMRRFYQGIKPPVERSEADFDPGAKYHIPGNTPYTRYFLAFILQYQLHRELCKQIGYEGPLHRCSIYGSEEAGKVIETMLSRGASQPWQDTLEEAIGQRSMDASAILAYFAPLQTWLDEQNAGRSCGWNRGSLELK